MPVGFCLLLTRCGTFNKIKLINGNNTSIFNQLEKRNLTYIGGLAKNRKVIIKKQDNIKKEIRLNQLGREYILKSF